MFLSSLSRWNSFFRSLFNGKLSLFFPLPTSSFIDFSDKVPGTRSHFDFNKKKLDLGPYVIQIGAFGSRENARRLKLQVTQLGHDLTINNVESNGKILYAVRVNRFKSKKQAEKIGKDIKSKIGVEYRILYRPIGK